MTFLPGEEETMIQIAKRRDISIKIEREKAIKYIQVDSCNHYCYGLDHKQGRILVGI